MNSLGLSWFFLSLCLSLVRLGNSLPISRAGEAVVSSPTLVGRSPGAKPTTCYIQTAPNHETSMTGSSVYTVSFSGHALSVDCDYSADSPISLMLDNENIGAPVVSGTDATITYDNESLSTIADHTLSITAGGVTASSIAVYFKPRSQVNLPRTVVNVVARDVQTRYLVRRNASKGTVVAAVLGTLSFLLALVAAIVLYRRYREPVSGDLESGLNGPEKPKLRRHNTSWIRRFRKAQPPASPFTPVSGFECPTRLDGTVRKQSYGKENPIHLEVPRTAHTGEFFPYGDEKRSPVRKLPPLEFSRAAQSPRTKRMGFLPRLSPWNSRRVQRVSPPRNSTFGSPHRVHNPMNPILDPHSTGQYYQYRGRF